MSFATRRAGLIALTLALAAVLLGLDRGFELWLRDASFLTGWLLAGGIVVLALYNARKKLPFLPLLGSAVWLQLHVYLGLLTGVAFLLHSSARLPRGPLEIALWCLFAAVTASGVVGILLSRLLPGRLQHRGDRLIFERIAGLRADLADEVRDLAMRSVSELGTSSIADFYTARLHRFFLGPRNLLAHLADSEAPLYRLRREIEALRRYMGERERRTLQEIEERVVLKSNLDRQLAVQSVLKGWLFVHIPLSYALIVLAAAHMVLAYAFASASL